MKGSPLLTAALTLGLLGVPVATAQADATVVVEVRASEGEPPDGEVTLVGQGSEHRYSCTTEDGACEMDGVAGGRYEVRFEPEEGEAPPPRKAMIPPSGRVTLIVSTRG
ncbi:MAG: hypothetical protein ACODAG_07970 [Myxococcota bacterium]